jgi:triosephosphate isomerase (TIM)
VRRPLIVANWKMHLVRAQAVRLAEEVAGRVEDVRGPEIILCPPATWLEAVGRVIAGTSLRLGAQTMHWEAQGAYTGEISPPMLVDAGCRAVILGHSERRIYFGETDETVGLKVKAAFAHGLLPIPCVGERFEEREAGDTDGIIERQVGSVVRAATGGAGGLAIAYEPVWAIGTGLTATSVEANRVAAMIRRLIREAEGGPAADAVRVLYGGSVKPDNTREFLREPDIDGALVGGASLDAGAFSEIVRAAAE